MAKKTPPTTGPVELVIGPQITIATLQRMKEDIGTWRTALQGAENVQNPKRGPLYRVYKDILLDAHTKSVSTKRQNGIRNRKIVFQDENGNPNLEADQYIGSTWFNDIRKYLSETISWGHSLVELGLLDGQIASAYLIPRENVSPEKGIIMLKPGDETGILFRESPDADYLIEIGDSRDLGLLLEAAPYVLYKRGTLADWAQFNEIFGMPFRKYTYDGHDEKTRILLEEAAKTSGAAGWAVLPKDSDIEFIQMSAQSGAKDTYLELAKFCNEELSKLFLGNTMTTDNGSSKSQAEVHEESEDDIFTADKIWAEGVLNSVIKPKLINLGLTIFANGHFVIDEPMDVDKEIDRDVKINSMVPLDHTYLAEKYGRKFDAVSKKEGGTAA